MSSMREVPLYTLLNGQVIFFSTKSNSYKEYILDPQNAMKQKIHFDAILFPSDGLFNFRPIFFYYACSIFGHLGCLPSLVQLMTR